MMKRISSGILCLLSITSLRGIGQDIIGQPKIDYSSKLPDVSAIQKAIDIPVSPFTGQATVSIPIYELRSRSISIPVSLDYTTGGIKADQAAGSYGLGWALNAGGMITRQVRGNEDEGLRFEIKPHMHKDSTKSPVITYYLWTSVRDSLTFNYQKYGGFYMDNGNLGHTSSDLYNEFYSHDSSLSAATIPAYSALPYFYNGLSDGEPDVFYFKFGTYSGKFIFGPNRSPILIPYNQDLQISPEIKARVDTVINTSTDSTFYKMWYFNSFKISTTDGKDYYFGESDGSKNYTKVWNKPNMYNGWQLTRIIDRNTSDTIVFEYTGGANTSIYTLENMQKFAKNDANGCLTNPILQSMEQANIVGSLSKITSSKELLQFKGNTIVAVDRFTGETFRQFMFSYVALASRRTGLKDFIIQDLKLNTSSMYSFDYYSQGTFGGNSAQDYWGYHNGVNNGGRLLIGYNSCNSDSANRRPAWPAMQMDALVGVSYPTGGKTIIEYEPHDANSGRNLTDNVVEGDAYVIPNLNFSLISPNIIGGIRVRRLMQYDPISKDTLIKRYIYRKFGTSTSSGHLYIPPSLLIDYSSLVCGGSSNNPYFLRSAQNLYIGSDANQHVSYSNVTVQEEKNGVTNGYTEYEYYNDTNTDSTFYSNSLTDSTRFPLNGPYNLFPSTQFKRLPENLLDGSPKEVRIYNRAGLLLDRTVKQYKAKVFPGYQSAILFTDIYKQDACTMVWPPAASNGISGSAPGGKWLYLDKNHDLKTDDAPNQTNGNTHPILPPPYSYYYMYRYIISKMAVRPYREIRQHFETAAKYVTDTTTYLYENTAHISPTSTISSNSKGIVEKQQIFYSFDFNPVNNGDSTMYFMQKANVNVPVASFNYVNGNIITGGYRNYRYRSRTDSSGFLVGEEYKLLLNAGGLAPTSLNISGSYPQAFSMPSSYFQKMAAFGYNPDYTIAYVIKKGNDKINLIWDYNKSFVAAQASGADSADIAFTGFETTNDGNWTVTGSARDTVSFFTGKRGYSLTAGNITKSALNSSKSYVVSYWSLTTSATVNSTAATQGATRNGWHYFEHRLPTGITSVSVSGTVKIDELRIYPQGAQMTSYSINPMTGVIASDGPDNNIMYFDYDGIGRLRFVRDADKNILKASTYFEPSVLSDTAVWRFDGRKIQQKCTGDTNYYSNVYLDEEKNININSSTYGATRQILKDTCFVCDISAWSNTANYRCQTDSTSANTGYQERQQIDINPCSPTYNQTRWVALGVNTSSCPLPVVCTGESQKIINGSCVTGTKIITASVYVSAQHQWSYTYHYAWLPNCITSQDYQAYSSTPIMVGGSCTPQ